MFGVKNSDMLPSIMAKEIKYFFWIGMLRPYVRHLCLTAASSNTYNG